MSEILSYTVTDELHGKRLDAALASFDDSNSRSVLGTLIKDGKVKVDGVVTTKPSVKVASGQVIELEEPERDDLEAKPQDIPLDVVY